jgi:predicted lipid-binding transport protein (Tim44 family)
LGDTGNDISVAEFADAQNLRSGRVSLKMVTRPEDIYPALSEAYNAGDLEALVSLYDPQAVFVIKAGGSFH